MPFCVFSPPLLRELIGHEVHSVVGLCWAMSLAMTRLYFLDHSGHMPPCANMVGWYSDPFPPCFAFLSITGSESLETVGPRTLGQLQGATERCSLETGRQRGRWRQSPPGPSNNGGLQGIRRLWRYHWRFDQQGVSALVPAGSRGQWFQGQQYPPRMRLQPPQSTRACYHVSFPAVPACV